MVKVIGTTDEVIELRDTSKLRAVLGFIDTAEMKQFINGKLFNPYYSQYATQCIYPQQAHALRHSLPRPRGPGLPTVEKRLLHGERLGDNKFFASIPDKSDWDNIDHCAYMLYGLRESNRRNVQGLFYGKGYDEACMHNYIWALVKYAEYNEAPSKRKDRPPPAPNALPAMSVQVSAENTVADTTIAAEHTQSAPADATVATTEGPPAPFRNINDPDDSVIDVDRLDAVKAFDTVMYNDVQSENDSQDEKKPPAIDFLDVDADVDELFFLGSVETLTNAERMIEDNASAVFNIGERFWQAWLIDKLIETGDNGTVLIEAVDYASSLDRGANAESSTWMNEVAHNFKEDSIIYQPFTEEAAKAFDEEQQYFDNVAYQREDLQTSCKMLNIPWDGEHTILRMPGMSLSSELTFWQPPGIKALAEFHADPLTRACVLADVVGLGKTWTVICYLMRIVHVFWAQAPNVRWRAKPFLIVVPVHLVNQWIRAIHLIAPKFFKVYKYHGDYRRHDPIANDMGFDGQLTKNHSIFNGAESNVNVIVVTTPNTWLDRHGPKGERVWLKNGLGMTWRQADEASQVLQPDWQHGLAEGCFETVIVDEAQLLKSIAAQCSLAIQWLKANFYVLVSATPMPNGILDWSGYMAFIEHPDAGDWYKEDSLKDMNFAVDLNPFDVPDDYPAAKLRLTRRAYKDWIQRPGVDLVTKGKHLVLIWKRVLLRRTHSSRIPFNDGRRIGENLPRVKAAIINCTYNDEEMKRYKALENDATGVNVVPGSSSVVQKKPRWSLATHRQLSMATMWLDLPALDTKVNLKATNLKATLEDKRYFEGWFDDEDFNLLLPAPYLQQLLCGAPKIRALLRNVRSQVVRDREKVLIWCQLPAVTVLLFAIFKLLHIEVVTITAFQKAYERDRIVESFNEHDTEAIVCIMTYAIGSTGLNMQKRCRRVHIIESAHNLGALHQALGRARRLGNPFEVVYLYEYFVENTFDDRAVWKNIEKAVSEAMAHLNQQIFHGNDESEGEFDIGEWVIRNGELMKLEEDSMQSVMDDNGNVVEPLTAHELLRHILMAAKGEKITL